MKVRYIKFLNIFVLVKSQNHRLIEWLGSEGTLKMIPRTGTPLLDQFAQSFIQSGLNTSCGQVFYMSML